MQTLDHIDLLGTLRTRTATFATPPQFIRGRVRAALHYSLEQILAAQTEQETTRAWTLWLLLPRMLLQRPWGTRTLPKDEWRARVTAFQAGEWQQLLATTGPTEGDPAGPPAATHHPAPSSERRAERARHLVHQGELSAARQALTASPLAPGTAATLAQLRDPTRRPTEPYTPLQANIDQFVPEQPLHPPTNSHNSATLQKGCRPRPIWPHSGHTAACFG